MKKIIIIILLLITATALGQGFLDSITDSVKKNAVDTFKNNIERDKRSVRDGVTDRTNSAVDQVSARNLKEQAEKSYAERQRQQQELAQQQRAEAARQQASRSVASTTVGTSDNPIGFSARDLQRIDTYAENMGVSRTQAIRILTVQGLNK